MPRKPDPLEPWMFGAIELIVRRQLSLRQAASQLGQEISPQQADNIQGHIRFQDALEDARFTYYAEVGSNPRLTKTKSWASYSCLHRPLRSLASITKPPMRFSSSPRCKTGPMSRTPKTSPR